MNATTTVETRVVPVTLNGETRSVPVRRAEGGVWWLTDYTATDHSPRPAVAYRYPTGKKIHFTYVFYVFENQRGELCVLVPGRNGRGMNCRIIGWATSEMMATGTCRW